MTTPISTTPTTPKTDTESSNVKPTVLESHGYYLGKIIGSGSFATVKRAYSNKHEKNVGIKIVSKASSPPDHLRRFIPREILVIKGLKHPNIIKFLQAIETTHRVYIIMEYAENGNLLDKIRKERFIDEERARKWFGQLVDAVEYCHNNGVAHRDIKCENILFDAEFNVKLSDFGFARGDLFPKNDEYTLSKTYCGSFAYASPEILRGIPYVPQNADIWSMGVVLFAMVLGELPFDDRNIKKLVKQVSNKVVFPKEPPSSSNVKTLIQKLLSPLKIRINISGIRKDSWFIGSKNIASNSAQTSANSLCESGSSKDLVPNLITKEKLEKEAMPRNENRRSTLEEFVEPVEHEDEIK